MTETDLPDFAPAPVRARRDGWTPERQRDFVRALASGLAIGAAAASVGLSRQTAYALRRHRGADSFAAAWDEALRHADKVRAAGRRSSEWQRAVEGTLRPVVHRGRVVGHHRRYDDRAFRRLLGRALARIGEDAIIPRL